MLLIGCPCALVISTPAAIASGLAAGARRGLLIKGGAVLETIGRVTHRRLRQDRHADRGPAAGDRCRRRSTGPRRDACSAWRPPLENGSSHPARPGHPGPGEARRRTAPPGDASSKALRGKGVHRPVVGAEARCGRLAAARGRARAASRDVLADRIAALEDEGKTVSVVLADARPHGLIAMRDEPRPDAVRGIAALRELGVTPSC